MSPADRIAELEERLTRLEQAQADLLQPGVFSLNAAGELEEILSGILEAQGIRFKLGEGPFHSIEWLNAAGEVRGAIFTAGPAGHTMNLEAADDGGGGKATLEIQGREPKPLIRAVANDPLTKTAAAAQIIANDGSSSFLQLATVANHKIAFGLVEITFAKSVLSGAVEVATGLISPNFVYVSYPGEPNIAVAGFHSEAGLIKIAGRSLVGELNLSTFVFWLAIE